MSALLITLLAAAVAAVAGWLAHRYHRDRADAVWADESVAYFARITRMPEHPAIAVMRSVAGWPSTGRSLTDHADEACAVVADDLDRARLGRAVRSHPAGKRR